MSRKQYLKMTRQGQLKRIRREMKLSHAYSSISDNHCDSEEDVSFTCEEAVQAADENIVPNSFPHDSISPLIQEHCPSNDNYSTNHNIIDKSSSSDGEHENQVTSGDVNDNIVTNLRHWALKYQVTHVATTALLNILKDHKCFDLPADARTLLKTPTNIITRIVQPGQYSHIGLEKNLKKIWEYVTESVTEILLLINIDGVPLFKSSATEFWPILGLVYNIPSVKSIVFPIGVYCGTKKPSSCTSFMEEFVTEVVNLTESGLNVRGKNIKVAIKGFVCDAPAKSFLLGVKGHTECITNKQYAIQQSHMIQIVSDLANQMAEINRKLDLLLTRSGETFSPSDDNAGLSELLASLPVKDISSFNNFDDHLKISKNKQAIMSFLSGIGGRNVRSLATNMLRRIILDVAELYSLTGKQMKNSNKKSFMSTETYKLIFQICRKIYEDVTEESLKEIISDWLNQAKVRLSRRAERQNKENKNQ